MLGVPLPFPKPLLKHLDRNTLSYIESCYSQLTAYVSAYDWNPTSFPIDRGDPLMIPYLLFYLISLY